MQTLKELVEQFDRNLKQYKSASYKEAQTRADFIDKFFILLGWDIYNTDGRSEAYRDCIFETSLKVNGKSKNPDYTFKIGIEPKFFVEAKKPAVDIKHNVNPAFQLRKYGYSASLPLSILTDFEEFAIYDTRTKPKPSDQASAERVFYCNFREYEKNWDYIHGTFAKDSIFNGSFDEYAKAKKKGTSEVDKEFLKEIESWRELLAKNIALRNKDLNIYDLNQAVQVIIDRIIFLRIAIDRNIEADDLFASLAGDQVNKGTFHNLDHIFLEADKKYNSGLFKRTGDRKFIQEISINDKPLLNILKSLETSPYAFNVMPIEILGSIYERFLGKTIRLTASHQAKVEEKPEVRKAGGVYYTPQYIVDYIIENTVGEKLKGRSPADFSGTKEKIGGIGKKLNGIQHTLTILDPACGSGSFLVNAYEKLLNWHLDQYSQKDKLKQSIKKELIYKVYTKTWRLTIKEKQRILLNHIYGVDIDRQAAEVTKLSLLLKLMEGESSESAGLLFKHSDLQLLPDLSENIKCGNSLIGKDFYEGKQMDMFTTDEQIKINTFDWEAEGRYIKEADRWVGKGFPEIMKQGGFDVVIGNPPYGAELSRFERDYLNQKLSINNTDTAALFMVYGKRLLKSKGCISLIIPKSFTYASNWAKTRNVLIDELDLIVDCSKVWKEVKLEMSIFRCCKNLNRDNYKSNVRDRTLIKEIGNVDKNLTRLYNFILNGLHSSEIEIGQKIQNNKLSLGSAIINQRGAPYQRFIRSQESDYLILGGKQIGRYKTKEISKGYMRKEYLIEKKGIIKPKSILAQNIIAHVANPKDHIIIIATLPNLNSSKKKNLILDTINQLENVSEYKTEYLLGLINSNLISWYTYRFIFGKAIRTMHFDSPITSRIPIPKVDLSNPTQIIQHDRMVSLVDQMLATQKKLHKTSSPSEKQAYQKQADILDEQIDKLVYELYELADEEIKIIENSN